MVNASYSSARENFAELWDKVVEDREVIIINRRGREDVALVAASELSSLMETAHLLRSPKNVQRLLTAILRARAEEGNVQSPDELRSEVGL